MHPLTAHQVYGPTGRDCQDREEGQLPELQRPHQGYPRLTSHGQSYVSFHVQHRDHSKKAPTGLQQPIVPDGEAVTHVLPLHRAHAPPHRLQYQVPLNKHGQRCQQPPGQPFPGRLSAQEYYAHHDGRTSWHRTGQHAQVGVWSPPQPSRRVRPVATSAPTSFPSHGFESPA